MKNTIKRTALCLSLTLGVGFAATACNPDNHDVTDPTPKATSYVGIDVNPSLSLVLDQNEKVMSVVAENEDAQILLYEESIVGLSVEDAVQKIADLSVELGYLTENNRGVNVTVEGDLNAQTITATVESSFEKAAVDENFDLNFTTEGTFSALRELKAINEEYDLELSLGEYEMIKDAQSVDKALTVDEAEKLSTEQLLAIIDQKSEEVAPYATAAYEHAKALALYTYQEAKASLIDKLWCVPYVNVFKYPNLTGLTYNLYSDSARALAMALDGVEIVIETKENTEVSGETVESIAVKLNLSDEDKQAYLAEITVDGKVTVASLESYLNAYFKNMTADERAAAGELMNAVMADVQTVVSQIDATIDEEVKTQFATIVNDLNGCIPDEMKLLANAYITEFKTVVTEISESVNGKEPLPAAYAALETLEENKERVYQAMRTELEEGGDLQSVEANIQAVNEQFAVLESNLNNAIAKAEQEAKDYFATKKAARKNA